MSMVKFTALVPNNPNDKFAFVDADQVRLVVDGNSLTADDVAQIYFQGSDICLLVKATAEEANSRIEEARTKNAGTS
jgi:hypothetical protein